MRFIRYDLFFFIWLALFSIFIFFYGIRKRKKILLEFASNKSLSLITNGFSGQKLKGLCSLVGFLFLAIAMLGPQYGYKWAEVIKKGSDIIIAVDYSKSMLANDIAPSRIERAKQEIIDIISIANGDRIGLIGFAGTAFVFCPLTPDYQSLKIIMNEISHDFFPIQGSNIAEGIKCAVSAFNLKDISKKSIILISDGESTVGEAIKSASEASDLGIKIFCIGIGKNDGIPVPDENGGFKKNKAGEVVLTKLNENLLKDIAEETDGFYVPSVLSTIDVELIYSHEIAKSMDNKSLGVHKEKVLEDRYQWFLSISLFFFCVEIFLSNKKSLLTAVCLFFIFVSDYSYAESIESIFKHGITAYEKKQYEKAADFFINTLLKDPLKLEVYYNLGNAYYKAGKFESALENYSIAIKSENKNLQKKSYYNRGNANYRLLNYEKALEDYKSALFIDSKDKNIIDNIEFVLKKIELKKKQHKKIENALGEESNEKGDTSSKKDVDGKMGENDSKNKQHKSSDSLDGLEQSEKILDRLKDKPVLSNHLSKKINVDKDW
ncbi:MAG: VWA domain-containing protein [Desulfobacterales bacterium]|nr:VWA domain-containing protein [Desulfobacterales bacterium]